MEPESIVVSPDGKTAWVTLQTNNGIAVVNVETASVTEIFSAGTQVTATPHYVH
jgi:YVTN family beta-propeller protein